MLYHADHTGLPLGNIRWMIHIRDTPAQKDRDNQVGVGDLSDARTAAQRRSEVEERKCGELR